MENQHRLIKGYRELDEEDVQLMNEIKEAEKEILALTRKIKARIDAHHPTRRAHQSDAEWEWEGENWQQAGRWLHGGQRDLELGFMQLVRSVARPD